MERKERAAKIDGVRERLNALESAFRRRRCGQPPCGRDRDRGAVAVGWYKGAPAYSQTTVFTGVAWLLPA